MSGGDVMSDGRVKGEALLKDAHEALRRARLEQSLIRAEKTAVLLGELAAVRDLSE